MKVVKQTSMASREQVRDFDRTVDKDLRNLFLMAQGRVRFGTGDDGDRGENMSGEFQLFTSDAVADTEFTVAHGLGSTPIGRIVLYQDKAGSLYQGPTTGTNWDSSNVYFKSDGTSVTFLVFLLK